jgi:HD-GYP domain-containing protein (c-di-GMP phosphodiesterase class II)
MPYSEVERITLGAKLHDLGKIALPAEILSKPGSLTDAEWSIVKQHTTIGHEIAAASQVAAPITDIVLHHHERLDGSGYPHGLTGQEIRIGSRVVAVADTVDAICSHRPYRPALGVEVARDVLRHGAGNLFDRDVVHAALAVIPAA